MLLIPFSSSVARLLLPRQIGGQFKPGKMAVLGCLSNLIMKKHQREIQIVSNIFFFGDYVNMNLKKIIKTVEENLKLQVSGS